MLERLVTSRVRIDLIARFVLHPDHRYHIRGLEKILDAQYSAIWRELDNLEQAGVVLSEEEAGRRLFRMNPDYPLADELRSMFLKTVGAGDQIREALMHREGIQAAFIFGSYAEGDADAYSDIDVMIVGKANVADVSSAASVLEVELGRPVNIMIYTLQEWNAKLDAGDPFTSNLLQQPKIMIVGSEDALR